MKKALEVFGFKQQKYSECMFKMSKEKFPVISLVLVYDLVNPGFEEGGVKWIENKLRFLFMPTDFVEERYYLVLAFEW